MSDSIVDIARQHGLSPAALDANTALSRRRTIKLLVGGVAAGALGELLLAATKAHASAVINPGTLPIERIGLQLYTVRRLMAQNIEGTIAQIAKAGITEVEFAGYYNRDAAWWKSLLSQHGMSAVATHVGVPDTDDGWPPIMDQASALGLKYVIVPSVPGGFKSSKESWQRLAAQLSTGAEYARKAGLKFGWHNHNTEFSPLEGTSGFEILTTETNADSVLLELDIYWAVRAGQDPIAIMSRWPGRVVCCHVKDAGPAPELRMMDVGAGTIDFRTILASGRKLGLAHWFIEHDNPEDPLASVTASAAAMKKL